MRRSGITLSLVLLGAACARGQTDIYYPYRFAEKWTADTLYLGASFRYTGQPPLLISLAWSETSTNGDLYVVSPRTGDTLFVMSNRAAEGTTVDLTARAGFRSGDEVVFVYLPKYISSVPRFTGPSRRGSRFFNYVNSDANPNPSLRFGRRFSVAGKTPDGRIEFGIEDSDGVFSDMDFNDIHFFLTHAELLLDMNGAKKRSYVW